MLGAMSTHFRPRKRFGQHFLIDETVLERIAAAIGAAPDDPLVEIGPGRGALTQYLLPQVKHLDVVEIDRDLAAYLRQHFAESPHLAIHNADALHFDWSSLQPGRRLRIVGNLPYNITTPLLFKLFEYSEHIQDMHFMLQKEVVLRLTAPVGSHQYGRLTIMAQYHAELSAMFTVPPTAFLPPPKVESALVRIVPHRHLPVKAKDFNQFATVVKEAFNHRRKTLANSLRQLVTTDELKRLDIDPQWRPEQITVANFVKISNILGDRT